jgi:hypothetical protein
VYVLFLHRSGPFVRKIFLDFDDLPFLLFTRGSSRLWSYGSFIYISNYIISNCHYCLQEGHRGCDLTVVLYTYLTISFSNCHYITKCMNSRPWLALLIQLYGRCRWRFSGLETHSYRACLEVAGRGCPFDKDLWGHNSEIQTVDHSKSCVLEIITLTVR